MRVLNKGPGKAVTNVFYKKRKFFLRKSLDFIQSSHKAPLSYHKAACVSNSSLAKVTLRRIRLPECIVLPLQLPSNDLRSFRAKAGCKVAPCQYALPPTSAHTYLLNRNCGKLNAKLIISLSVQNIFPYKKAVLVNHVGVCTIFLWNRN